jgi:DNA-directed RNA polymerase subunit L
MRRETPPGYIGVDPPGTGASRGQTGHHGRGFPDRSRYPYLYTLLPTTYLYMDIKILEREGDKVRMVLKGQGHTFMNALTEEILSDPAVDVAKYVIKYQFSDPELLVTTKEGKDPLLVVREACSRITAQCDDLIEQVRAKTTV